MKNFELLYENYRRSPQDYRYAVSEALAAGESPEIDGQPSPMMTPLGMAACCDLESVKMLLAAGADIDGRDCDGNTALIRAAKSVGKPFGGQAAEITECLIAAGADVGIRDANRDTALIHAVKSPKGGGVAGRLIAGGADIDAVGRHGYTAIRCAAAQNVGLLAAAGADPDIKDSAGESPLIAAVMVENVGKIKALLAAGADVNAQSEEGRTALEEYRMRMGEIAKRSIVEMLEKAHKRAVTAERIRNEDDARGGEDADFEI